MTRILDGAALLVVAAGIVVFASAALSTRLRRNEVALALELWTAAGLLRLSSHQAWTDLLTAAVIVAVRRAVLETWLHPRHRRASR